MNERPFSNSTDEEQTHVAERELSSFMAAVKELYGPEEASLSANDWLDESELMDSRLDRRCETGALSPSRLRLG